MKTLIRAWPPDHPVSRAMVAKMRMAEAEREQEQQERDRYRLGRSPLAEAEEAFELTITSAPGEGEEAA